MENPATLLRRARQNRRMRGVLPARLREEEMQAPPDPPHRSSRASYTALMRSHDRARTRHIGGKGGGNGA